MAVAALASLIPLFYFVASDVSRYYFGRHLWFGFFVVYGIVVQLVQMPWNSIAEDFQCHGNITDFCVTECFEKVFNIPVTGIWCYLFFVCMGFFFLFEFFMAKVRRQKMRKKLQSMEVEGEMGSKNKDPSTAKASVNFHHQKTLLFPYILYFLLLMGTQCIFLFLLLNKHLPLVSESTIPCNSNYCPGTYLCLIRGTTEKQMSIYTLVGLSFLTIMLCLGFLRYSIYHYLTDVEV